MLSSKAIHFVVISMGHPLPRSPVVMDCLLLCPICASCECCVLLQTLPLQAHNWYTTPPLRLSRIAWEACLYPSCWQPLVQHLPYLMSSSLHYFLRASNRGSHHQNSHHKDLRKQLSHSHQSRPCQIPHVIGTEQAPTVVSAAICF